MAGLILWLVPLLIIDTTFASSQCDGISNCNDCRSKTSCFWCPASSNQDGKCLDYFNMNIASLICRNPSWKTFTCSLETTENNNKVDQILNLIMRLEKLKQHSQGVQTTAKPITQPKPTELLDLNPKKIAEKLAALKEYLRNAEEKQSSNVENELESTTINSEVTELPKSTLKTLSLEEELNKDINSFSVVNFPTTPKQKNILVKGYRAKTTFSPVVSAVNTPEATTVKVTTNKADRLSSTSKNIDWDLEWKANSVEVKSKCSIIKKEFLCNVDLNCSWCHLSDSCVGRSEKDLRDCFHNDKRVIEEDFGVDPCMQHITCGTCTNTKGKCYWCEHTKSCHIYPFFGFVPHTCPTNHWYYKQCNVQFALLLFMFPLLLVLISMLIFYFCLRYCFYRKRLVKVPLFERPPGTIYEKKKGKKIYFMSGEEDEDSRAEKIRKKYQLPAEKEPLIAP